MFKIICKIYLFVKIRNNLYEVSSIFLNTWPQLLSPSSLMTWKRGRPFFSEWQLRRCSQWVRCDRLHSHRDYLCLPKDKINEYSSCLSVSSMVTVLPLDLWALCIGKIISQRKIELKAVHLGHGASGVQRSLNGSGQTSPSDTYVPLQSPRQRETLKCFLLHPGDI